MGVRRVIGRKKVGCRSLIDANLEGQVGINEFKLYIIEIMKQLKQVSPNYKSPTSSVSAIAAIYPFYFHLNIPLHILNTIS